MTTGGGEDDDTDVVTDHPYYCADGSSEQDWWNETLEFDSWSTFRRKWGETGEDLDVDMNQVFRFDVNDWDEGLVLEIHIVHQRKGCHRAIYIDIDGSDWPEIKQWLEPHYENICEMWRPISDDSGGVRGRREIQEKKEMIVNELDNEILSLDVLIQEAGMDVPDSLVDSLESIARNLEDVLGEVDDL